MYEPLMRTAMSKDLDIVATSWYKECVVNVGTVTNLAKVSTEAMGREDFLRYVYIRDSYQGIAYMWNKLYRREILLDGGALREFDESNKMGGDVIYLAQAILLAQRSMYVNKPIYHYRTRENSGSHTNLSSSMRDWVETYEYTIRLLIDKEWAKKDALQTGGLNHFQSAVFLKAITFEIWCELFLDGKTVDECKAAYIL